MNLPRSPRRLHWQAAISPQSSICSQYTMPLNFRVCWQCSLSAGPLGTLTHTHTHSHTLTHTHTHTQCGLCAGPLGTRRVCQTAGRELRQLTLGLAGGDIGEGCDRATGVASRAFPRGLHSDANGGAGTSYRCRPVPHRPCWALWGFASALVQLPRSGSGARGDSAGPGDF
jgi:hypothetical protein